MDGVEPRPARPSQERLDEVRAWRVLDNLAKLALSATNNLSDNSVADDPKQHRQCYLFDLCLLRIRIPAQLLGEGHDGTPGGQNCLARARQSVCANFVEIEKYEAWSLRQEFPLPCL
jgi:hypothetical protein